MASGPLNTNSVVAAISNAISADTALTGFTRLARLRAIRAAQTCAYPSVLLSSLLWDQTNTKQDVEKITADRITPSVKALPMCRLLSECNRAAIHMDEKRNGRSSHGSTRSRLCLNHLNTQTLLHQSSILFFGHPINGKCSSRNVPSLACR